jgi:3,4-dihydroxy 2-butanone 4-phosphate synthase/GTP cyclohydrolase II
MMANLERFLKRLDGAEEFCKQEGRPFITVTYAQGVDGSIALETPQKIQFSGPDTQTLTHRLRAAHDAILLGIGTVLADNPLLTVRLVEGPSPRPIVLDTHLRIRPDLRLMNRDDCKPLLITGPRPPRDRQSAMEARGARILTCGNDRDGRVDLGEMVRKLAKLEPPVSSLMVEGGGRVISAFTEARLVDFFIITVTPCMLGGVKAMELSHRRFPYYVELNGLAVDPMGRDVVLWASPSWKDIRQKMSDA